MDKWIEENGKHILWFNPYYWENEKRLAEVYHGDDGWCCNSKLLNIDEEYLDSDTLEDAKEIIKDAIIQHYEDELNYYQELLDKFKNAFR